VEVCPWNLLEYSSVLSDASYSISELSRTDSQTDPNGGNTGALFTGTSATNAYILKSFSTIIGQVYNCFVYLKGNSSGSVSIRVDGAGTAPVNNVNYTTSYQQFTYTFTADSTTSTFIIGGYATWTGSEAIYVAFPQANIGSTAKPYFPTTDSLNVPRLTYQNGGGGCPSLLLEKQSTNLILWSEQFDNTSAWTTAGSTVTANNTTSPDGTQNADLLTFNVTAYPSIYQAVTTTNGATYTASIYAKKGNQNFLGLEIRGSSSATDTVFNLNTGVIVSGTGTIESVGNGWYRCSITKAANSTSTLLIIGRGDTAVSGDTLYLWGAQFE
jgi:hypothetical protein